MRLGRTRSFSRSSSLRQVLCVNDNSSLGMSFFPVWAAFVARAGLLFALLVFESRRTRADLGRLTPLNALSASISSRFLRVSSAETSQKVHFSLPKPLFLRTFTPFPRTFTLFLRTFRCALDKETFPRRRM